MRRKVPAKEMKVEEEAEEMRSKRKDMWIFSADEVGGSAWRRSLGFGWKMPLGI